MIEQELPFGDQKSNSTEDDGAKRRIHKNIKSTRRMLQETRDNPPAEVSPPAEEPARDLTVDQEVRGLDLPPDEVRRRQSLSRLAEARRALQNTQAPADPPVDRPPAEFGPQLPAFRPGTDQPPDEEQTL